MTQTVREFLKEYNLKEGYGTENGELIETLLECSKEVWSDAYLDEHRWYACREVVVELDGRFIAYSQYIITGETTMGDMDLEYNLDEMSLVEKKERVVTETYYA